MSYKKRGLQPYSLRPRAAMIPSDVDFAVTADTVVDDPREPRITPIGILDERGHMLCRVTVPIKVPMGFHIPNPSDEPDEVECIVPEDMLAVSDCGLGVGFIHPDEVEGDEEPDIDTIIKAALHHCNGDADAAKKLLADNGIVVDFTVTPIGEAEA